VLYVPPDIQQRIAAGDKFDWPLIYNGADEKSNLTYLRVRDVLAQWESLIIQQRLDQRRLPAEFVNPFDLAPRSIATAPQVARGLVWSRLFPFLLVIMSLTGAFYPAVDLGAGEKERGTMETLLISPAARSEIVAGKFITTMLFSMCTAMLNLASLAATGWVMMRQLTASGAPGAERFSPPGLLAVVWIGLMMIPLSALFSAACLALSAFARSTKEAQYYLTPLFLVTMPLVVLTIMPGTELNAVYSVIPVTGSALLLKALILTHYDLAVRYALPVFISTVVYAVLALVWAIDQYNREEVLFRESERADLGLWLRHLLRDREELPTAGQAMLCFAIMLALVWFLGGLLTTGWAALVAIQLAFVAAPAAVMTLTLTSNPRGTLLLHLPRPGSVVLAVGLALALHPSLFEFHDMLRRNMNEPPQGWQQEMQKLFRPEYPLLLQLAVIAGLAPVCEELAFRGFILRGLLRRFSIPAAVAVNALLFGFFHVNPQQLLNATLLGALLGVLVTRTASLWPGVCFHAVNNAVVVILNRVHDRPELAGLFRATAETQRLVYCWPMVIGSVVASAVLIYLWVRQPVRIGGSEVPCAGDTVEVSHLAAPPSPSTVRSEPQATHAP
jgi:sodium transport system permease protein